MPHAVIGDQSNGLKSRPVNYSFTPELIDTYKLHVVKRIGVMAYVLIHVMDAGNK
jgi:hypothetical protein